MSAPKRPPVNPVPILAIGAALLVAAIVFVPAALAEPSAANIIIPVLLGAAAVVALVVGIREFRTWTPYRNSTTPEQRKRLRQEYVIVKAQEDANKWVR